MAVVFWRGYKGSAQRPNDGLLNLGRNWEGGVIPDETMSAVFASGNYTATLEGARLDTLSFTIGAVATVRIRAAETTTILSARENSVNYGHIVIDGGTLDLGDQATLANFGVISGNQGGLSSVRGGLVSNLGTINITSSGGGLVFMSGVINQRGAAVESDLGGGIVFLGEVINKGIMRADNYGLLDFGLGNMTGSATNFVGGVLSGGDWEAGSNAVVRLAGGGTIETLAGGAKVVLSAASTFGARDPSAGFVTIEESLQTVSAGSALQLQQGRSFDAAHDLDIRGVLRLDGGTVSADSLASYRGSLIAGAGTIAADTTISGKVQVVPPDLFHTSLTFKGDANVNATLAGEGKITFADGDVIIGSNSKLAVAALSVENADLRMGTFSYAGQFSLSDTHLTLIGESLRLKQMVHFSGVEISGAPNTKLLFGAGAAIDGVVDISVACKTSAQISVDGSATFASQVYGSAEYYLNDETILTFKGGVGTGQIVTFAGDHARLRLEDATSFKAILAQFGSDDAIELTDVNASSRLGWHQDADGSGGRLDIFDDTGRISLRFDDGVYSGRAFELLEGADGSAVLSYHDASGLAASALMPAQLEPLSLMIGEHIF